MKLSFSLKNKEAKLEADIEKLVEKGMDQHAKIPNRKTRYQIRQEENRKNKELEQKQFIIGMLMMVGLLVVLLIAIAILAIIFPEKV